MSKEVKRDLKFQLLDSVIDGDKSVEAANCVLFCKAALPSLEDKKQAWTEIIKNSAELSKS